LITNKKYFLIILFFSQIANFPQTDWIRWEKSDPSYQIQDTYENTRYDLSIETTSDIILKPIINSYWFFISDVDGANCPFYPSCSRFFLQSVKETNIAQGALMFFDRFTRDTNFLNRQFHYPYYDGQHFYDPVALYTLDTKNIKYIPPNISVKE